MTAEIPIVLTVAGSNSSGGAGIQADLKTFSMHGVYGATVITALTAQNTRGVSGILPIPPDFIAQQFRAVTSDLNVSAIKTGMLNDAATVETVARLIGETPGVPVVVDPVMVATSGDVLLASDAIEALTKALVPRAVLITPNIPEAARILGTPPAADEAEMLLQAKALLQLGCGAVLLKGGHGRGAEVVDIYVDLSSHRFLRRARIETRNTHGTGCTLSAAIAANIAFGMELEGAIESAAHFVWRALSSAASLDIGHGNGPIDHNFAFRK